MVKSSKLLIMASAFVLLQSAPSIADVWDVINVIQVAQKKPLSDITPSTTTPSTTTPSTTTPPTQTVTSTLDQQLCQIFKEDNYSQLQKFIATNSNFDWVSARAGIPWPVETATPLICAIFYGAVNCVTYLLKNNVGLIVNSIPTKNSKGYTASNYASQNASIQASLAAAQTVPLVLPVGATFVEICSSAAGPLNWPAGATNAAPTGELQAPYLFYSNLGNSAPIQNGQALAIGTSDALNQLNGSSFAKLPITLPTTLSSMFIADSSVNTQNGGVSANNNSNNSYNYSACWGNLTQAVSSLKSNQFITIQFKPGKTLSVKTVTLPPTAAAQAAANAAANAAAQAAAQAAANAKANAAAQAAANAAAQVGANTAAAQAAAQAAANAAAQVGANTAAAQAAANAAAANATPGTTTPPDASTLTPLFTVNSGQQLTSFYYSPVFTDTTFGEIGLDQPNIAAVNTALASGISVIIQTSLSLNSAGAYQATITAYNGTTKAPIGTPMSTVVTYNGTSNSKASTAKSLNQVNIAYQRTGDKSTLGATLPSAQVSSTLLTQYILIATTAAPTPTAAVVPAGTISSQGVSFATYAALKSAFTSAGVTLTEATMTFQTNTTVTMPYYLYVLFGSSTAYTAGYSFFSDAWSSGTYANGTAGTLAADLKVVPAVTTSTGTTPAYNPFANVNWLNGVTFVMLAFDNATTVNVITDLTKVSPASFSMFIYDNSTQKLLGAIPVPVLGGSKASYFPIAPSTTTAWPAGSNAMVFGASPQPASSSVVTYPAALTLTGMAPAPSSGGQGNDYGL